MSFWIPEPYILAPGEALPIPLETGLTVPKTIGAHTEGHFGLFEMIMPPLARGPELHVHHIMTEMFFVHAGVVEIHRRGQTFACGSRSGGPKRPQLDLFGKSV